MSNDWRATFNALEEAAERGRAPAVAAVKLISDTIAAAFAGARDMPLEHGGGLKLNGADPCERVAEALAVWIVESDVERFADELAAYEVRGNLPPHLRLYVEQRERETRLAVAKFADMDSLELSAALDRLEKLATVPGTPEDCRRVAEVEAVRCRLAVLAGGPPR
jgi:hypothetical protein